MTLIKIISLDLFSTLVFIDRGTFNSRTVFYEALLESSDFRKNFSDETSLQEIVKHYHFLLREEMYNYEKEEEFNNEDLLKRTLLTLFGDRYPNLDKLVKEPIAYYFEKVNSFLHTFDRLHETLDYLKSRKYRLIVISNHSYPSHGEKVLKTYNLNQYFDRVVFSGNIGYKKPSNKLFHYALRRIPFKSKKNIVHIGDDFIADVEGAIKFGINAIWIKNDHNKRRAINSPLRFQVISEIKDLMKLF